MAERPLDLGWLRLFEAIGRHKNLTRVAEELRLSQPAVSYQLRRIEESVGAPLVQRLHRGAALTREGAQLHDAVVEALTGIDEAVRQIRRRGRQTAVRIHTDFGFASYWLMPRISAFRRLEPDVEVHILASQSIKIADTGEADLYILFGRQGAFGASAVQLMEECVRPVCSPAYLAKAGPFREPADLARQRLIHLEGDDDERWFSWQGFLKDMGVARQPDTGDLSFNAYHLVLQAALGEEGLALGWTGLVDDLVKAGLLTVAGPALVRPDRGYWLVQPSAREAHVDKLAAWLLAESRPPSSSAMKATP
ncbi:MAG TPA: LysR substrate-binding domain-containing protein [Ensifer sp.]|nr:LysR substrate-binding domain-containing protein [Ensifer sp.]